MILLEAADTAKEAATETVVEVTKEASKLVEYFESQIPALISFGIKVLLAFVVFFIGTKVIKLIRSLIKKAFQKSNTDIGVEQFVDSLVKFALYIILIFTIATKFGVESTSVAALLASGGVAIGLALQGSLSNFAGGILILILKPFVVGDYIIEDNKQNEGVVKEIKIFYTKLSTLDNKTIVIPNGSLANNSLTNVTEKEQRRLDVSVSIAYSADLKEAKNLLLQLLKEDEDILENQEQIVFVDELGEHGVLLGVRSWIPMDKYWVARWRLLEGIKLVFDREGIEIPYQQMVVRVAEDNREKISKNKS